MDSLLLSYNNHCEDILAQVAPVRSSLVTRQTKCPWINYTVCELKHLCRRTEHLWKSTKLEVHRLHLKELTSSLNETRKNARSEYFHSIFNS